MKFPKFIIIHLQFAFCADTMRKNEENFISMCKMEFIGLSTEGMWVSSKGEGFVGFQQQKKGRTLGGTLPCCLGCQQVPNINFVFVFMRHRM
jgi:hypothetical protein